MAGWPIDERGICAALTAAGGLLLALRLGPRAARVAWATLLVAGLTYALFLSLRESNLININLVHHYLGAKYSFPYNSNYELINAALERPQVEMRDLDHPPAMTRADPREQRAYYIDSMRGAGVDFDALVPLVDLQRMAEETGVIRSESERILAEYLPQRQIEDFRRDVRAAVASLSGRDITTDYGFNGSPFYALERRLDPTLHVPFGRATAWFNLIWQVTAALAMVWIVGIALEMDTAGRLAMAAFLFASWDFVGWALPGLIFAGLWIPVAVALVAMRRCRAAPAGIGVAWAGLIKLFPFLLVLPALTRVVRAKLVRRPEERIDAAGRWSIAFLVWCVAAVGVLGLAATWSGRSWGDFLDKIAVQFQSQGYLMNSVSLSQGLLTLGIHGSPLPAVLSGAAAAALVTLLLYRGDAGADFLARLPRLSLVLLAATGWLVHTWFNYYAVAPLLLLPLVARRHRASGAAAAMAMAVAYALPEFDDPKLLEQPALHALKLAPYLLVPAWLVALEFGDLKLGRRALRMALVAIAVCAVGAAGEALRMRAISRWDRLGGEYLDNGDAGRALERYRRLVSIAPRNAMAHMNEAIAMATAGNMEGAGKSFARAAALAPGEAVVHQNYGMWLSAVGRLEEAAAELETAREIRPYDDRTLYELARVRLRQERRSEASSLLARALELNLGNRAAFELLLRIGSPGR